MVSTGSVAKGLALEEEAEHELHVEDVQKDSQASRRKLALRWKEVKTVLKESLTDWDATKVDQAAKKLSDIKVFNTAKLVEYLEKKSYLNDQLRDHGKKGFSASTLAALRDYLQVKVGSNRVEEEPEAEATPTPKEADNHASIAEAAKALGESGEATAAVVAPELQAAAKAGAAAIPAAPREAQKPTGKEPPSRWATMAQWKAGVAQERAEVHTPLAEPAQLQVESEAESGSAPTEPKEAAPAAPAAPKQKPAKERQILLQKPAQPLQLRSGLRQSTTERISKPRGIPSLRTLGAVRQAPELDAETRQKAKNAELEPSNLDGDSEVLTDLLDLLDQMENLTANKLLTEYRQRGYPADSLLSRVVLRERVTEAVKLECYSVEHLLHLCQKEGLPVYDAQPKEELLALYREKAWEAIGIPIGRFPGYEEAQQALELLNAMDNYSAKELADCCKERGLPRSGSSTALKAKLRKAIIWEHTPLEELIAECKAHGTLPGPAQPHQSERAHVQEVLQACKQGNRIEKLGIPAAHLGEEAAQQILADIDRLQDIGQASFKAEFVRRNVLTLHDSQSPRQVLVERLKDILVWDGLPLEQLQALCQDRGLDSVGTEKLLRRNLLQWRVETAYYEVKGIAATKLRSLAAAKKLKAEFADVEGGLRPITDPFVLEHTSDEEERLRLYKSRRVYQEYRIAELRQLCKVLGLPAHAPEAEEAEERDALVRLIQEHDLMLAWEARGFHAFRIGQRSQVLEVVKSYEGWQQKPEADLKAAVNDQLSPWGIQVPSKLGRDELLEVIKDLLVWKQLPLSQLELLCMESDQNTVADAADMEGDQKLRKHLINQLLFNQSWFKGAFEEMGLPLWKLHGSQGAKAREKLASAERKSTQKLLEWYHSMNLPLEPEIERFELVSLRSKLEVWKLLQLEDLRDECQRCDVLIDDDATRDVIMQRLIEKDRIKAWDSRGFRASDINSFDKASSAVETYVGYSRMSDADLKQAWVDMIDVSLTELTREERLAAMKQILVWLQLPLQALERECQQHDPPIVAQSSGDRKKKKEVKNELIQQLVAVRFRSSYEKLLGHPLEKFGLIKAARAASFFDLYSRMSITDLKQAYASTGLVVPDSDDRAMFERLLKAFVIYDAFTTEDLWQECLAAGVEDDAKAFMQDVLIGTLDQQRTM